MKRFLLEATALVTAAALCAVVANAMSASQKKVAWVGDYPKALEVPPDREEGAAAKTGSTPSASAANPIAIRTAAPTADPTTPATQQTRTSSSAPAPRLPNPATPQRSPEETLARFQPHPDKPSVEIQYHDVVALHRAGALFLDARRSDVYQQGHIAGARAFSVWEADIDKKVNALFDERNDPRDQNQPIVIYCSGGACEDSHMLAQKLWGIQFNNVYVYKDGYPDWQKRGGATRQGATP